MTSRAARRQRASPRSFGPVHQVPGAAPRSGARGGTNGGERLSRFRLPSRHRWPFVHPVRARLTAQVATGWLVSNDYDAYARNEIDTGPEPERRLIMRGGDVTVGIKTWVELIEEDRARLQFFQEHLSTLPTKAKQANTFRENTRSS